VQRSLSSTTTSAAVGTETRIHPKLAPQLVDGLLQSRFIASKAHLNAVFKPGAFGGQLMAQALYAALASSECTQPDSQLSVSSQMSSFMGPVLLNSDVLYRVATVRESGKTFVTTRVQAFQNSSPSADLESVPLLFESTISLYRAERQPRSDPVLCPARLPENLLATRASGRDTADVLQSSIGLEEITRRIDSGRIKRGALYRTAVRLAQKMSVADMHLQIRFPIKQRPEAGDAPGRSAYWVGVDPRLLRGLGASANLSRILLPYVSDGMTQVLAFSDPLDSVWDAWPRQISVWNYSMWFSQSVPPMLDIEASESKWFYVEYSMQGVDRDLGLGHVKLFDWPSKALAASASFHCIGRK
jgi:acyl-CoA thioesterase